MQERTLEEYIKLAENFYLTHLSGRSPTPKRLCDALKAAAANYRPNYWRRLRRAIACDQREKGFDKAADAVAATKNPITSDPGRKTEIKPKQRRAKSVSAKDEQQLIAHLVSQEEEEVYAAVALTKYLGCRPAELRTLVFDGSGCVLIIGAKKRADRGLNRHVLISDPELYRHLMSMHLRLVRSQRADPVRYAQKRLAIVTQRLWPQRKARPTLCSFRHQLGADLKASGKSAQEVAAIMGHRSPDSVSVYGNRALSRHSRSYLRASAASIQAVQDKEPKPPYSAQQITYRQRTEKPSTKAPGIRPPTERSMGGNTPGEDRQ